MDGLYAETIVKKKATAKETLLKLVTYGGMIFCFIVGLFFGKMLFVFLALVLVGLAYYLVPRLNVEWEYVFCDGQLDFDRISGGSKRKTILRVDFEHLVVAAPKNSHALDGYRHNGVEVKDFTSLEEGKNVYGMVITGSEQNQMIFFEPSEKMIAAMKQKAPRKIVEY
ncbi:MAG: hypothetical protein E7260_07350 [Lachnospiraceae bacterium]|nr:hypothetical protein [Lachnospiraceae bacterium]